MAWTTTESVLAFAFLFQLLILWTLRGIFREISVESQANREFQSKIVRETRNHYESAMNSLQEKFMARSLPEYNSAKSSVNGTVKQNAPDNVEVHEEAMRIAEQTGLPISTVYERMRTVSPQPSALVGGEALD